MNTELPFPVLHIYRRAPGFYRWVITEYDHPFEEAEGLESIERCIQDACCGDKLQSSSLEIRYQGVGIGTFRLDQVLADPSLIAELVVTKYAIAAGY